MICAKENSLLNERKFLYIPTLASVSIHIEVGTVYTFKIYSHIFFRVRRTPRHDCRRASISDEECA